MTIKRRIAALLATGALGLSAALVTPAVASAAPTCTTVAGTATCTGATTDGALYQFSVPATFNGTLFLYSHGTRPNIDLRPAGLGAVDNSPEVAPSKATAQALLTLGYGVAGSGFARQGWNTDSAVKTNVELVGVIKAQFPAVKKVVAWGSSQGAAITQILAEQNPNLVDAVGLLAPTTNVVEQLQPATDVLWMFKVFFDPSIKGFGYSAGAAGYVEALTDLAKFVAVLKKLQAGLTATTAAASWPDTASPAGKALSAAIPARSILLLIGLLAGIPTRSAHFDNTTGPGDPNDPANSAHDLFVLAVQPMLGVMENMSKGVTAAVVARYDLELQTGGNFSDNSNVDYSALLGDDRDTFGIALSGDAAIDAALGVLKASPRIKADPAALAKAQALGAAKYTFSKPTVYLQTVSDYFGHDRYAQRNKDAYEKSYLKARKAAEVKAKALSKKLKKTVKPVYPARKLLFIWADGPEKYTKFVGAAPDTSGPDAPAVGHVAFTDQQYVAMAVLLGEAAKTGKVPTFSSVTVRSIFESTPYLVEDPDFRAPLPKQR